MDELLDIVNEYDDVVGQLMRSEIYAAHMRNFRVINAFIKNAAGQLWIPRRVAHKKLFPLALDVSVGGHVLSGESYERAFERELEEELNLKISDITYREIGALQPHRHGVSAFMRVFEIHAEKEPLYNSDDFCESSWLLPNELKSVIEAGEKAKSDLIVLLKHFYCV